MSKQLKVKDLKKYIDDAINAGHADKYIIVADDNEGNGYHGLFFQFTTERLEQYVDLIRDSVTENPKEFVILG